MAAAAQNWQPHNSLTTAPTNLKEAIDWVLRVTGRDGKKNVKPTAASPPQKPEPGPHCLCYLAKAVKDLLYDAKDPGSPGPSPKRNWDDLLLDQEKDIVNPVLTDLGLVHSGSTSAASSTSTCAGGTEVIRTLIDQLAQGLQKWVGWKEGDECCLKGEKNSDGTYGESSGIGKKCKHGAAAPDGSGKCCNKNGTSASGSTTGGSRADCVSNECQHCGINPNCNSCNTGKKKCYLSAYQKHDGKPSDTPKGDYYWPTISEKPVEVHLLARIFLGSVCLIWSGLSQLGFLTGGDNRWKEKALTSETEGLGSFMAAMGYDLDRLNQGGPGQTGDFVHGLLTDNSKGVTWQEFTTGATKGSVAEYYSSIYDKAKEAAKGSTTHTSESICKDYPLLVLHILASGYFRAGSAGANKVTVPASPAPQKKDETDSASKKPRHPRTIREILYWLSALPYSQGYKTLVGRMGDKYPKKEEDPEKTVDQIELYNDSASVASTTLLQKDITHYLMAACGYCPLVLIGIQGTIENKVDNAGTQASGPTKPADPCPESSKKKEERTECDKDKKLTKEGKVCYGGYHLEVSKFGPLHGMYANGLFGFQMDGSPAQCLDQLRVYVYHCFYQLYFLRKQCGTAVLGWQSCRYGSGVNGNTTTKWICKAEGASGDDHTKKCGLQDSATSKDASALQSFLYDALWVMVCEKTKGVDPSGGRQIYPEIDAHMNKTVDSNGREKDPHRTYPQLCPVPMGWSKGSGTTGENHFKDLKDTHKTLPLDSTAAEKKTYPVHCTGRTLSHLLAYYCDPGQCHGSLVVLLRLLACITPTVPRTLGDLFGFYYYIVYIGGKNSGGGQEVNTKLTEFEKESKLYMLSIGGNAVVKALNEYGKDCNTGTQGALKCLVDCTNGGNTKQCSQYLSPLSGQQYGQLSPLMAGTYLSWLVYLIEGFNTAVS